MLELDNENRQASSGIELVNRKIQEKEKLQQQKELEKQMLREKEKAAEDERRKKAQIKKDVEQQETARVREIDNEKSTVKENESAKKIDEYLVKAAQAIEKTKYKKAEKYYRKVLAIDGENQQAIAGVQGVEERIRKQQEIQARIAKQEEYNEKEKKEAERIERLFKKAQKAENKKRYSDACEYYESILAIDSNYAKAVLGLQKARLLQEEKEKSETDKVKAETKTEIQEVIETQADAHDKNLQPEPAEHITEEEKELSFTEVEQAVETEDSAENIADTETEDNTDNKQSGGTAENISIDNYWEYSETRKRLRGTNPEHVEDMLINAETAYQEGYYALAESMYNRILELDGSNLHAKEGIVKIEKAKKLYMNQRGERRKDLEIRIKRDIYQRDILSTEGLTEEQLAGQIDDLVGDARFALKENNLMLAKGVFEHIGLIVYENPVLLGNRDGLKKELDDLAQEIQVAEEMERRLIEQASMGVTPGK